MPNGVEYSRQGYLWGTPTVATGPVKYNVTATNAAGSFSAFFDLDVTNCPHGPFMLFHMSIGSSVLFELQGDGFYLNGTIKGGSIDRFCIPYTKLELMLNNTIEIKNPFALQIYNEQNVTFFSTQISKKGVMRNTIDFGSQSKPVIAIPSSVMTSYVKEELIIPIVIKGQWNDYEVEPALPETFSFDRSFMLFKGSFMEKGIYSFNLTYHNQYGSDKVTLVFKVDECYVNEHLVVLSRDGSSDKDSIIFSSETEELYTTSFTYQSFKHNLCLPEGAYHITLKTEKPAGGWTSDTPLLLFDENGGIIGMEILPTSMNEIDRFFFLTFAIPTNSTFLTYCGQPETKWTSVRFRDSKWSEGQNGKWGECDSLLYMRKTFSIDKTIHYGHIDMNIVAVGSFSVYVNENLVLENQEHLSEEGVRYSFSASLLRTGKNVIAIALNATGSNPIVFDFSLQPLMSSTLEQSYRGIATDNQTNPDPFYPPSHAFDKNTQTYWNSNQLPVELNFAFENERSVAVNELMFFKDRDERTLPTHFIFEGVNSDNSTILLFSYNSTLGFLGKPGYKIFTFVNNHVFNQYRFTFMDTMNHVSIRLSDVRMFSRLDLTCQKRKGFSPVFVDETSLASCPLASVGTKQGRCINVANEAVWEEDRTACVPRWAEKGYVYLDWSFRLHTVSAYAWGDIVNQGVTEIITRELTVKSKEISYPFVHDISTDNEWILDIDVRFTLEVEIGDYVKKHLPDLTSNFTGLIRGKYPIPYPMAIAELIEKPVLRFPFPVGWVVSISSVVCICIVVVVVYCVARKTKNVRTLKKTYSKKGSEKETLL